MIDAAQLKSASELAKNLVKQFKGLIVVGDALGSMSDMQDTIASYQVSLGKLKAESDKLQDQINTQSKLAQRGAIELENVSKEISDRVQKHNEDMERDRQKVELEIKVSRDTYLQEEKDARDEMRRELDVHDNIMSGLAVEEAQARAKVELLKEEMAKLRERLGG